MYKAEAVINSIFSITYKYTSKLFDINNLLVCVIEIKQMTSGNL